MLQRQSWRWILLGLGPIWANDTYGFCCLRACFCAHKLIRARAMGLLRMSWLRALSTGRPCWCWCCGLGCWWLSARLRRAAVLVGCWCRPDVSWQSALVLASAGCARCGGAVRWLCVQAVYILVPASRMSTSRGMLPSYLGLCWLNL